MAKVDKEVAAVAVEMILKHGLPLFISVVRSLESDNPTVEEIRALRDSVKDPEEYFDNKPGQDGGRDETAS